VMVSLEDPRMKSLSEVLGNKTCKKIIDFLAENDCASAKDISDGVKIPLNTVDYNMKKLLKSELVEKRKKFFWSVKGKRIVTYGLSNKTVVISPKSKFGSKLKSLVPGFLLTLAGTFAIYVYEKIKMVPLTYDSMNSIVSEKIMAEAAPVLSGSGEALTKGIQMIPSNSNLWIWFLAGGLIALIVILIVNWRKL